MSITEKGVKRPLGASISSLVRMKATAPREDDHPSYAPNIGKDDPDIKYFLTSFSWSL